MTWAPDYCTSAELKNYLSLTDVERPADDLFIGLWITTASRNVDDFCGRQFGQVATEETRTYTAVWDRHEGVAIAEIDDLMNTDNLTVIDADAAVVSDYTLLPANSPQKGKPYERISVPSSGTYTLDGLWGWDAVPSSAKVGLLLQAARLDARRDSPFGVAGSPTDGSEIRLLAQLDPDFRTSLKPFRRDWWAA